MNKDALINQLYAMRAQIEAALLLLGVNELEENQKSQVCPHPPDRRKDHSTMGHIIWQCGVCGYLYEEVNHGAEDS